MSNKFSEGTDKKVVAVVVGGFFKKENINFMKRMEAIASKNHIKFVYFSTVVDLYYNDLDEEGEKSVFDLVPIEKFDAIVLFAESYKDEVPLKAFIRGANLENIPIISTDKSLPGSSAAIRFDYSDIFKKVIDHMLEEHDYNTIYFMGGIPGNTYSENRLQIFKDAMVEHGKAFNDKSIYYGHFWDRPCISAMNKMFNDFEAGHPVPDCIICANDIMAITVCEYLMKKGYRVPEDIAVSGLDGISLEEYFDPRLTTGVTDYDTFTEKLLDILNQDLPADTHLEDVLIPSKLQIGCSCGCLGLSSKPAGAKILQTDAEFSSHLTYELDCSQLVSNNGISIVFEDAMKAVPKHLAMLMHDRFWFVANEDFAQETQNIYDKNILYTNNLKFTEKMSVWNFNSYQSEYKGFSESINFGDILPNFSEIIDSDETVLILPVHTKGTPLGYSVITYDYRLFSHTLYLTFVNNFKHMIGLQYDRIHLLQSYITDSLTGLYNRSGFNKRLETIIENNPDEEISLISIDICKLKEINDSWGHEEGDNAIKELSKIIIAIAEDSVIARIEGDQFMICIHGDNLRDKTDSILNTINHQLEHRNQFTDKYYSLSIKTNYYVSEISSHTTDYILKKADDLLYSTQG